MVTASTHSLSFAASIHQNRISSRQDTELSCRNVRWTRSSAESVSDFDNGSSSRPSTSSAGSSRVARIGSQKGRHNRSTVKERKRSRNVLQDKSGQAKMIRLPLGEFVRDSVEETFQSSLADGANDGYGAANVASRIKATLSQGTSSVWSTVANRNFFAGAMTAGALSFTMCSSAVADARVFPEKLPVETAETTMMSEHSVSHFNTQTGNELRENLKVPEGWPEENASQMKGTSNGGDWHKLKELRTRLHDHGQANLTQEVEAKGGKVVPVLYPSAAPLTKDAAFSRGSAIGSSIRSESLDHRINSVSLESYPASNTAAVSAPDNLLADGRTGGPVASVSVLSAAEATVPGVSLLSRLMMHFGGGGVAGAMGATLVYPLDTIKTRMQAQSDKAKKEGGYRNEWDCFLQMVTKEGPGSLYSGLLAQLVGIAPEKAMKLTVNDVLMEMLESEMPGVRDWALELVAGGGGGFCQVVFTNPMEIVKVRLQTQAKDAKQKSAWDVIKELGLPGLYSGSSVTIIRDVPSTAIFFAFYTLIRHIYPDQSFMAGFVAAIPATILVTPFDVVKTRIQMEHNGQEAPESAYACFRNIMREEGVGALFKGSVARVLKTSPQFGLTLMLYNILSSASLFDIATGFLAHHIH